MSFNPRAPVCRQAGAWGATTNRGTKRTRLTCFNPRAPVCRQAGAWGATAFIAGGIAGKDFVSIHAPLSADRQARGARQQINSVIASASTVSIHAPLSADRQARGARLGYLVYNEITLTFQSTRPCLPTGRRVGRDHINHNEFNAIGNVSIHAPLSADRQARGARLICTTPAILPSMFQSTRPRGARRLKLI